MDLPEIGGELCLLVAPARYIGMRRDDLAPRLERAARRRLDQRAARFSLLAAYLLVEREPPKLHLHLADFVGLCRRDGGEQPCYRVECAVSVVARERLLVRPLVPKVAQFLHQRAFGAAECPAEDVVPRIPHQLEQRRHVPLGDRLLSDGPVVAEVAARYVNCLRLILALEFALN